VSVSSPAGFDVLDGDAEKLPLADASTDVVISNGVLNLATDKHKAFSEILRVLRPGGRLLLADIVVQDELSEGRGQSLCPQARLKTYEALPHFGTRAIEQSDCG
jgi:ubiquinone/menaquinone biosynthesis C-methylase UbiE